MRWRWPAKNHANTAAAGTVEAYIANTPNSGDDFTAATPIAGQMSYSSDGGDCLGLAQSTDTADCQGTWTVPSTLAEGRYSIGKSLGLEPATSHKPSNSKPQSANALPLDPVVGQSGSGSSTPASTTTRAPIS